MREFRKYIALGDSISIDLYPALDVGETDVAVALEWDERAGRVAPLGAASLLYRNDDSRWPEFAGRDLVSASDAIDFVNLAEDGATIGDVFGQQLAGMPATDEPVLVTLSVGGNDLLSALMNQPAAALLEQIVADVSEAYELLVQTIRAGCPRATLVLTTVYDPSDDTGRIPGVFDGAKLPLRFLHQFNEHVRGVASATPIAAVADVYAHFLGHGVTAPEAQRWYWRRSLIEPNAQGASEVRRVWLDALGAAM